MKLAELDWAGVLAALGEWEALSPAARAAFVQVLPSPGAAASRLGGPAAELKAAGLVEAAGARGTLVGAAPRFRALLEALRAVQGFPVLDAEGGTVMEKYVREHFAAAELGRLQVQPGMSYLWADPGLVAHLTSSADWVEGFLALRDVRAVQKWGAARLAPGEGPYFAGAAAGPALQALLRALGEHPRGVPLRELCTLLPALDDEGRAGVLRAGLRFLFLFPTLREDRPELVVGLAPAVARRFGPAPSPPAVVEAAESFALPYRLADMVTVLVEATVEPIPVRGADGELYVRAQRLLAPRLQPLPEWVGGALGHEDEDDGEEDEEGRTLPAGDRLAARLGVAAAELAGAGLARMARGARGKFQLEATAKGQRWVALSEGERLRQKLDAYRASDQRNPLGWYGTMKPGDFFPMRLGFDLPKGKLDLRAALTGAFLSIPEGKMVPLDDFLAFQGRAANPFLALGTAGLRAQFGYSSRPGTREEWEQIWSSILLGFLAARLVPHGGARLGRTADGASCVGLAAPGRYLLGATGAFEYEAPAAGEILVQPDFEIVFLAPAPGAELEIARFAERIGSGVGALFRVTRASVMRGAHQGVSAEAAVATLQGLSRSGVPANVARQIRDWAGATRQVSLAMALLVECPDAETAARVLALTGGKGVLLAPTVIRLPAQALDRKTFARKLRDRGIFIAP